MQKKKQRRINRRPLGSSIIGLNNDEELKKCFYNDFFDFMYRLSKYFGDKKRFKKLQLNFIFKPKAVSEKLFTIHVIIEQNKLFDNRKTIDRLIKFDFNMNYSDFIKHVKRETEAIRLLIKAKFREEIESIIPETIHTPAQQKDCHL